MARIPTEELERLKAEISVERLVESAGIELKPAGKDLLGRRRGTPLKRGLIALSGVSDHLGPLSRRSKSGVGARLEKLKRALRLLGWTLVLATSTRMARAASTARFARRRDR